MILFHSNLLTQKLISQATKSNGLDKSPSFRIFWTILLISLTVNIVLLLLAYQFNVSFLKNSEFVWQCINSVIVLILIVLLISMYVNSYRKGYLNRSDYSYFLPGLRMLGYIFGLSLLNGPLNLFLGI